MDWRAVYHSEWQGVWALVPIPLLYALWLARRPAPAGGAEPRAAGFVHRWAIGFALASALDPLCSGLLPRALGFADAPLATAILVVFVLLGDFRVFLVTGRVADPAAPLVHVVGGAAAWTLVVPLAAVASHTALQAARGPLPPAAIWLLYELAFAVVAVARRAVARGASAPATAWLRAVWTYVLVYYALWATADVLVTAGVEEGWALRIVPNQLYYVFSVPVFRTLFVSPRYAATSTSTHASR
jgi:hypothetical protein